MDGWKMNKIQVKDLALVIKRLREGLTPFGNKTAICIHRLEADICNWLDVQMNNVPENIRTFLQDSK